MNINDPEIKVLRLVFVLVVSIFSFSSHLDRKEEVDCFTLIVFLIFCD